MKKSLEILGMVVLVAGVCGVVRELTGGWFRFMGFTRYLTEGVGLLHGKEVFVNVVVAVLGLALLGLADRVGRR
ncbi:hypothetical protein NX801_06755 [Streptomyces sp. LP05-1]|uniref:Integral membrane protein n=1 Tax=Streptomyces pyxinae TaxID=2970734 RepID=A0ABT2CD69_9ACTN|nr:hypothetical protein [Streptomyces sp. LP05-1]MCS0635360.1 hypothetical protein [Streptomyces sp. LP05-1]